MSCKKESSSPPPILINPGTPKDSVCRLKSWDRSSDKDSFAYDLAGRIVKIKNEDGSYADIVYEAGKATIKAYDQNGFPSTPATYELNSLGMAVYRDTKDFIQTIFYDADGYLIKDELKFKLMNRTYTLFCTYKDGDLIKEIVKDSTATSISTTSYIYTYSDILNKAGMLEGHRFAEDHLIFKPSKHLLASKTEPSYNAAYTYTFNAEGYPLTRKSYPNGQIMPKDTYFFTYECR